MSEITWDQLSEHEQDALIVASIKGRVFVSVSNIKGDDHKHFGTLRALKAKGLMTSLYPEYQLTDAGRALVAAQRPAAVGDEIGQHEDMRRTIDMLLDTLRQIEVMGYDGKYPPEFIAARAGTAINLYDPDPEKPNRAVDVETAQPAAVEDIEALLIPTGSPLDKRLVDSLPPATSPVEDGDERDAMVRNQLFTRVQDTLEMTLSYLPGELREFPDKVQSVVDDFKRYCNLAEKQIQERDEQIKTLQAQLAAERAARQAAERKSVLVTYDDNFGYIMDSETVDYILLNNNPKDSWFESHPALRDAIVQGYVTIVGRTENTGDGATVNLELTPKGISRVADWQRLYKPHASADESEG